MKNKKSILTIGGITLFITLVIFLLGIDKGKRTIDYISFLFIVLGECITFGTMAFYKQPTMISNLSITSSIPVYLVINILFSLMFKNVFADNVSAFAVIHLVLISILAILIIVLSGLLSGINKEEENTIKQKAVIDECERLAQILMLNSKYENHRAKLNKIYDDIKYSDHVSDYKSSEILSALNSISVCTDENEIAVLCEQTIQLIQDRNITVNQLKRGGFWYGQKNRESDKHL